jgi:acetate kinase
MRSQGIRRYGGDGICHAWAWRKAQELSGRTVQRLVSIHLDDQPNVAAILNGQAVETSQGFSRLEGLPSAVGSGDIDPSIALLLRDEGLSNAEIQNLFEQRSGWNALAGEPLTITELLGSTGSSPASPRRKLARQVFETRMVETLGAATAALGGVDMLLFSCTEVTDPTCNFAAQICDRLSFINIKFQMLAYDPWGAAEELVNRNM